jgi:hypothetical protein
MNDWVLYYITDNLHNHLPTYLLTYVITQAIKYHSTHSPTRITNRSNVTLMKLLADDRMTDKRTAWRNYWLPTDKRFNKYVTNTWPFSINCLAEWSTGWLKSDKSNQ